VEPKAKIELQAWMTAPETAAVVAALTSEGATVRFVGGCVRDALLGRTVKDIDIATHDPPETVTRLLEKAGIKAVPTGIAHGTVTAVVGHAHFEITTLRKDVETYGRRAKVAFTNDWAADAARRDFTFNTLFCAPDGAIYDPFDGIADLRAGRVRFVGNAEARIREDVLRLLRFFRFYAHYGKGAPDEAALSACRKLAHLLPTLSGERVAGELLRLMAADDPASVAMLMEGEGVLTHVLPEAKRITRLAALVAIERGLGEADALRRLAAALVPGTEAAIAVAERLRLSNAESERLIAVAAPESPVTVTTDSKVQRRELYRLGKARYRDLALLSWAGAAKKDGAEEQAYRSMLAAAEAWQPVALPIKGRDVLALGVENGPEVGRLLKTVEAWWIEGDFRADREACLKKLKSLTLH
jgi:poly(A) polymerase